MSFQPLSSNIRAIIHRDLKPAKGNYLQTSKHADFSNRSPNSVVHEELEARRLWYFNGWDSSLLRMMPEEPLGARYCA